MALHTVFISIPGADLSMVGEEIEYGITNNLTMVAGHNLTSLYMVTDSFRAAGRNVDFQYGAGGVHAETHNGSLSWVQWMNGTCVGGELRGDFSVHQVVA